jgi:intracellular multiplication protein IcmK
MSHSKHFKITQFGKLLLAVVLGLSASSALADDGQSSNSTGNPTSSAAFQQLLNQYFPLTPQQIHEFKNAAAEEQKASAMPPGEAPPESSSTIIPVSLKPGGIEPVVRIGQGMISSLVFTDASGSVWPVTSYLVGDPASFNVQWDKQSGVLMVQGQKLYSETNIGVMLQGLSVPVMLTLLVGQKNYDYLDYIRVQAYMSGDISGQQQQPVPQAPDYLMDILSGVPPQGAAPVQTTSSDIQVWAYNGDYLMLTQGTLLSPAWTSTASSTPPNVYHAYELPAAPVVILSMNGKIERVTVGVSS